MGHHFEDIAEYYLSNYYDRVKSWITERKAQTERKSPRR